METSHYPVHLTLLTSYRANGVNKDANRWQSKCREALHSLMVLKESYKVACHPCTNVRCYYPV